MARFRNRTSDTLSVNAPPGHPDAHEVKPGDVLSVPGEFKETADAYLVGTGDKARAYNKAQWEAEVDKAAAPAAKNTAATAKKEK